MQYGAWWRGEPGRRGVVELEKQSNRSNKGKVVTGGGGEGASKKVAEMVEQAKAPEKPCEGSRAYVAMRTD